MNPDVFSPVAVPDKLRPFVRRILVAACDDPVEMPAVVRATGYTYLGWIPRGRWQGFVNGEPMFDTASDGSVYVSGQVIDGEVGIRMSGRMQKVVAEFTPLGHWELLGIEGAATVERADDPEALNSEIGGALRPLRGVTNGATRGELCSMFVGCLETLADSHKATPTYLRPAIEEIEEAHGNVRLGKIESRLGISERQFRRQFQRFVGMSPKTFCRTLQVNAALSALLARSERKLPELAVEFGFADQSHMIRAFAEFMGTSPTRLLEDLEPTLARFVGQSRTDST